MSGGRFDYIDSQCKNEIFGWLSDEDRIPNIFEDKEISELIWDVFDLIHEYDCYASGDDCKETYLEAKAEFKRKWLKGRDEDRVKHIVDTAIEEVKQELYETYGIGEE